MVAVAPRVQGTSPGIFGGLVAVGKQVQKTAPHKNRSRLLRSHSQRAPSREVTRALQDKVGSGDVDAEELRDTRWAVATSTRLYGEMDVQR